MGMMTRRNVKQRAVKKTAPVVEDFGKYMNEPEVVDKGMYTKTEINRMSIADLKKLASENGIDESLSGAEIKKALIEKFGL